MTLRQALTRATEMLANLEDIENPSLESEVLLKHALQIDRVKLLLEWHKELSPEKEVTFFKWIERRLQGEPIAYIIHCREFYGLDFYVDNRVLIPRPETELLVEEAIGFVQKYPLNAIADIGTGSGAVAISLAVNLSSQARIYATDISASALAVADINCRKHAVVDRITLLQGDLLDPLPEPVDLLIANLPYVQKSDLAGMPFARYEPPLALDGGESGLDKVFRLCRQLKGKVRPGGCVLLEIGEGQGKAVNEFLLALFPSAAIDLIPDLARIERVVKVNLS